MHASAMLETTNRAQRLIACLGDPSRFRVVTTLHGGEYCVTDLARKIGLSQSCTTRHLQALQREGLVVGLRHGKRVVFRLNTGEPMIASLVEWVTGQEAEAAGDEFVKALPSNDLNTVDSRRQPGPPQSHDPDARNAGTTEHPARSVRAGDLEDFLL